MNYARSRCVWVAQCLRFGERFLLSVSEPIHEFIFFANLDDITSSSFLFRDLRNRNLEHNEHHSVVEVRFWLSADDEPNDGANRCIRQREPLGERLVSSDGDLPSVPRRLLEHHLLGQLPAGR